MEIGRVAISSHGRIEGIWCRAMKYQALWEARWIFAILVVAAIVASCFSIWAFLLIALFIAYTFYFFRDPDRSPPEDPLLAVAPADGVVVEVVEVEESELLLKRVKRVSIFLSVFDVHVNRAPIGGEIMHSQRRVGRFLDARNPQSGALNERHTWLISGPLGSIIVRQITGAIARRICPWKNLGNVVERGERFGMIRFGSRTEVDFPIEAEILVKLHDRVKCGETPVARMPQP